MLALRSRWRCALLAASCVGALLQGEWLVSSMARCAGAEWRAKGPAHSLAYTATLEGQPPAPPCWRRRNNKSGGQTTPTFFINHKCPKPVLVRFGAGGEAAGGFRSGLPLPYTAAPPQHTIVRAASPLMRAPAVAVAAASSSLHPAGSPAAALRRRELFSRYLPLPRSSLVRRRRQRPPAALQPRPGRAAGSRPRPQRAARRPDRHPPSPPLAPPPSPPPPPLCCRSMASQVHLRSLQSAGGCCVAAVCLQQRTTDHQSSQAGGTGCCCLLPGRSRLSSAAGVDATAAPCAGPCCWRLNCAQSLLKYLCRYFGAITVDPISTLMWQSMMSVAPSSLASQMHALSCCTRLLCACTSRIIIMSHCQRDCAHLATATKPFSAQRTVYATPRSPLRRRIPAVSRSRASWLSASRPAC